MKLVRVLHVVASMDPAMGGVSKAIEMIIEGLSKHDTYNAVLSMDLLDAPYIKNSPFPIFSVGNGKTKWRYNPELLKWLQKHLKEFDVVIVHGLWLYNSYATYRAVSDIKRDREKPRLFVMPHGMLDPYFQSAKGRRLKSIRNWIFWKIVERKVVNEAYGVLFTCEMERILARKTFSSYKPKRELIVGLGIKAPSGCTEAMLKAFSSKAFSNTSSPYLLYIGRIDKKKGIDILIQAYLNAKSKNVNLPSLVIAGPGIETLYGQEIKRLALKSPDIYFTGMLTGDAKWGAFYGSEAFVLSSHQENFGIAVVEAMACGKAALISDQINIWKEIKTYAGGLIAQDSVSSFQKILEEWVVMTSEEKELMGSNAKSCYENCFSISTASVRLLNSFTS
jgi:glycosyltransferase involved in cell wall biosynthesis